MSRYQGRRVTDPKPVVRADVPDYPIAGSGLEGAWESMTKAKSVLRRAEFRMLEAENPTSYDIGLGPISDSVVSVDRVPSYTISQSSQDGGKGAMLDDYGRTAYMKSKLTSSRKISRLDGKYTEEQEPEIRQVRPRSPLRESSQNYEHKGKDSKHRSQGHRSRYSEHKERDRRDKKKYELDLKPVKYNDSKSSSARVYWSDDLNRQTGESSNITDMSAVRDTDVRFLNDTERIRYDKGYGGGGAMRDDNPKLTHVDIKINKNNPGASTYPRRNDVNSTYTLSSSQAKKIRKLKVEDFRKKSDKEGFEKLKEKILRQKMNMSSDTGSDTSVIKDIHHHDNEAVVPKDYSLYESQDKPMVLTRKIASGPAAPHYKGFNEAETHYTLTGGDGKSMKTSELQRFKKQLKKDQEMYAAHEDVISQGLDLRPVRDTNKGVGGSGHTNSRQSKPQTQVTPKKMTRVIARKPTKQEHQSEVITTRSWREGQKLVQKELGKMPKVREEGTREPPSGREHVEKEKKDWSSEQKVTTVPLSANAKGILDDLMSDKSESESDDNKMETDQKQRKKSPPFKRKRPRSLEPVREEKKVKVPNYDRQDVQRYMKKKQSIAKQKEQQKKEEERLREEKKKQNLEKLYTKQRETAKRSRSKGASTERVPLPAHSEKSKASSGSDKENKMVSLDDSGSATLTDGSEPPAIVQQTKPATRKRSPVPGASTKKEGVEIDDLISHYLAQDKLPKEEERRLKEQTTQELIHKYLKSDAEAKREQTKPELVALVTNLTGIRPEEFVNRFAERVKQAKTTITSGASSKDVIPHVDAQFAGSNGSSKAERTRNLQLQSNSLSSKLRARTADIASLPIDRWAQPVNEEDEEAEFVSRYERIIGGGNRRGQEVFTGDLPGVGNAYAIERNRSQNEAASRIQAAYRGHTVRQNISSWQQPQQNKHKKKATSADNLSDSTQTEDSEADYRPGTKGLSSRMAKPAYCVEDNSKREDDKLLQKYSNKAISGKPKYAWEEKGRDPMTVFNVYARKQKQMGKDGRYYTVSSEESMDLSDLSDKDRSTSKKSQRTRSPVLHRTKSPATQRSQSPTSIRTSGSYRDDFEPLSNISKSEVTTTQPTSRRTDRTDTKKSAASARSHSAPTRKSAEGREKQESGGEDEDTLEGTSLSHSIEDSPESERKKEDKAVHRSNRSKTSVETGGKTTDMSESFTYSDDSEPGPKDPLLQYNRESGPSYPNFGKTGYDVPRMSPAALEYRMKAELVRWEGMEESLRQATDIDRIRGTSMAQQESVSLAQIIKAKQEVHLQEMANLQMKTKHEKSEAARQLDEAQKRASEAAQSAAKVIHEVRTDVGKSYEESTRKLIESQANAAKATFEAAKQLAEKSTSYPIALPSAAPYYVQQEHAKYQGKKHMGMPGPKMERSTQYSQRSYSQPYTTDVSRTDRTDTYNDSFDSQSSYTRTKDREQSNYSDSVVVTADDSSLQKTESIKSEAGITAEDMSKQSTESIRTESGAAVGHGRSPSQTESITEDVHSEKASLTEEEIDKISRDVMPSEGQRRKLKKNKGTSDIGSFSEDFPTVPSRRLSFEEDSFSKFAAGFYEQYVHQEDMRQKHQDMLLRLREKAVNEKLSAEMDWYDQQKKSLRDKGADDKYPQLRKKQRGVIMRLKQEKAEIKKLQEVSRRQQQFLKLQMQDINKMRHSSKQPLSTRRGIKHSTPLRRISPDSSETELSAQVREKLKKSSAGISSQAPKDPQTDDSLHGDESLSSPHNIDYKSDSEIYSESNGRPPSPSDAKVMQKLKKMKLDEKYLTVREQRLLQRRKNAHDLLMWKQLLDDEETEIEAMERKALAVWDQQKKRNKKKGDKREMSPESKTDSRDTVIETTKYTPRTPRGDRTESVASEIATETIATEKDTVTRTGRSITEDIANTTARSLDRSYDKSHDYTIDSSIQEEDHLKKTHDSSDDTITHNSSVEYTNDTFEDPTSRTQTSAKKTSTTTSPRQNKRQGKGSDHVKSSSDKRVTANGKYVKRGGSESESDDSVSLHFSETTSDQSDLEGRVQILHEKLKKRKLEVEKLKKEHKKNKKHKLRQKEEDLAKKIEACDSYIKQVEEEIQREREQDPATVKPQIKIPGPQTKKTTSTIEPPLTKTSSPSSRSESDSSKWSGDEVGSPLTPPITTSTAGVGGSGGIGSPLTVVINGGLVSANNHVVNIGVPTTTATTSTVSSTVTTDIIPGTHSPEIKGKIVSLPKDKKAPVAKTVVTKDVVIQQDKSELNEQDYTEDISEAITAKSDTQDKSEVKLILDLIEKEDTKKEETEKQPDTARSITDIPDEPSSLQTAPYTEKSITEKTTGRKQFDSSVKSEKSIYSEYTDDYENEKSDKSDRSYSYTKSSRSSYESTTETQSTVSKTDTKANQNKKQSVISDQIDSIKDKSVSDFGPVSKDKTSEKKDQVRKSEKEVIGHTEDDVSEEISSAIDEEVESGEVEEEKDLSEGGLVFNLNEPAPAEEINKSLEIQDPLQDIAIGDRVLISGLQAGTLRFKGYTKFALGFFAGVELDQSEGSNNGSKENETYFTCKENHGVFVPPEKVSLLPADFAVTQSQESVENIQSIPDDILVDIDDKTPLSPTKDESALDRAIKEAEQNLEEFSDLQQDEVSPERTPTNEQGSFFFEEVKDNKVEESPKQEKAAEIATQNLMNEALNQIFNIRKKKKDGQQDDEEKSDDGKDEEDFGEVDIPLPVDDGKLTVTPIDGDDEPLRPLTPDIPPVVKKTELSDIEKLYDEMKDLTGDPDGFWMEDEFGFNKAKPEPNKGSSAEMKLDLQKLTQQIFYAIPNKKSDVDELVDSTVDVYWEKRRYGESWDDVAVPSSLYKSEDKGADLESRSRKTYKHLVFDLSGEVLRDMYQDEDDEVETAPWEKSRPTKRKYYKGQKPPTTQDNLKPLMKKHVSKYLGVEKDGQVDSKLMKVGGRKKKDNVDQILIQELREEEPDWVNYDKDELSVKMQLSDAIFDSLLVETGQLISGLLSKGQE